MKIALASAQIIDNDINYNLAQMERYMREAKANGADQFFAGNVQKELPIFNEGLLYVVI